MVKGDYWAVTDAQLIEKTGHPLAHWTDVLDGFGAGRAKSNAAAVSHNV